MSVETFKITLYVCGCGYKTTNSGNATKHKKVSCGNTMTTDMKEFVLKEDYDKKGGVSVNGDHNTTNVDNSTVNNNVNITLVLPERTTKEDFVEYLESMERLGFRTPEQVAAMPGKLLMFTRGAKELPGALIERNKKIIEKLPDGTERIMGKKKAVRTYTHEAIDACLFNCGNLKNYIIVILYNEPSGKHQSENDTYRRRADGISPSFGRFWLQPTGSHHKVREESNQIG